MQFLASGIKSVFGRDTHRRLKNPVKVNKNPVKITIPMAAAGQTG
jgi:hypothetical protein